MEVMGVGVEREVTLGSEGFWVAVAVKARARRSKPEGGMREEERGAEGAGKA